MPLKLAFAVRVGLPLVLVVGYMFFRAPSQAAAGSVEILVALIVGPVFVLLAAYSAAQLLLGAAEDRLDRILCEELDGEEDAVPFRRRTPRADEPELMTHEFHPLHAQPRPTWEGWAEYPVLGGKHELTEIIPTDGRLESDLHDLAEEKDRG
jgi:hypothetical protein